MKNDTSKKASRQRKQIERFCEMLGLEIDVLEWEPIGVCGEMCGPSGGWAINTKCGIRAYGMNADDLCREILTDARHRDQHQDTHRHYLCGRADAAKHKDAVIEELQRRVVSPTDGDFYEVANAYAAGCIWALLRAVHQTGMCEPPIRQMWVLREIADRTFGKDWASSVFMPPRKHASFEPIPKAERERFLDGSPWNDLEAIRQAAGSQDTSEIVSLIRKGREA